MLLLWSFYKKYFCWRSKGSILAILVSILKINDNSTLLLNPNYNT